jgi:uncharacterized cupredoxin-like copper-binding protein
MDDPGGAVWQIVSADQVPEGAETAPMAAGTQPGATDETDQAATEPGEANTVDVSLVEMAIQMPAELPAGRTTFEVSNRGEFRHSFLMRGEGIEEVFDDDLDPGETNSMTIDLEPGQYEIICPVGNHAAQGMSLTLTVTE